MEISQYFRDRDAADAVARKLSGAIAGIVTWDEHTSSRLPKSSREWPAIIVSLCVDVAGPKHVAIFASVMTPLRTVRRCNARFLRVICDGTGDTVTRVSRKNSKKR